MLPKGLHAVGNGVSLLPWMKMTCVRWTGPAAPKPMTGTPSDMSMMTGKSGGSAVPTVPPAITRDTRTRTTVSPAAIAAVVTRARDRYAVCSDFGSFVTTSSSREGIDVPYVASFLSRRPSRSRGQNHHADGTDASVPGSHAGRARPRSLTAGHVFEKPLESDVHESVARRKPVALCGDPARVAGRGQTPAAGQVPHDGLTAALVSDRITTAAGERERGTALGTLLHLEITRPVEVTSVSGASVECDYPDGG